MLQKIFVSLCLVLAACLAWPLAQGDSPFELGLDLAGGTMVTYRPDLDHVPAHSADIPAPELLGLAKETLASRLALRFDTLPDVVVRGDQRIVVSLPGEHDQRTVLDTMGQTYRLSFRAALAVHDGRPAQARGMLARYEGRWLDLGPEVASGDMLDPRSIRVAMPDARGLESLADGAIISFTFRPPFDDRFAEITAANVGRTLAILLDDQVEWAGEVSEEIRGSGMLRGGYDLAQATEVAGLLRSGNLPLGLDVESLWSVGPVVGQELLQHGRLALGWSVAALASLLVLAYGRRPPLLVAGLVSLASLLFFTAGLIAALGLTVDLVAVAGLVLSIGMGMDAFILVFEALTGESGGDDARSPLGRLRQIYGLRGEGRTLVHANATTLLVVLLLFASERLQSFATFLVVGLAASLLTLVVTRWLLAACARRGWLEDARKGGHAGLVPLVRGFRPGVYRWRRVYFAAVALFLVAAAAVVHLRGDGPPVRLGADFQPGVQLLVRSAPEDVGGLVDDLRAAFPDTQVRHQSVSSDETSETAAETLFTVEGLEQHAESLSEVGPILDRHDATLEYTESIDPRLSARRIFSSLSVLTLSFVFLGLYLGAVQPRLDRRWLGRQDEGPTSGRGAFVGTVAAVVLDVIVVLAALALLRLPLGLPVLAALLTIVGYSVNDSMVLWSHLTRPDEIRRGEPLRQRITRVVDRILGRTVLTSLSTMLPALVILAVGIEPLTGFAWAVVVGTVSGTLSSIFVVPAALTAAGTDGSDDSHLTGGPR